ncbi:MAG: cytochrome c oxidase subunit II [Anaerolineae bacterium]|jgi:cytochrome c oxidase subunit 2
MPSSPFNPVSPQAQSISNLFILVLIIGMVILAIVTSLVIYASIRYRSRPGEGEPPQTFGNRTLEISWTAAPALLLAVLLAFTIYTMQVADPTVLASQEQPDLVIIAHQWWWEVHYPKTGVTTANEIHIPAGTRLLTRIESADVIHDFWVPQLGRKMDAIPGHPNHIWLEANTPGTYLGSCAEYCGLEHAWMRIRVIAQTQDQFKAWEQEQLQTPTLTGEAAVGKQLYMSMPCVNCHVDQPIGPDLTHFGSRETIGTGVLENTPDNLAKWLRNPQAVKPGVHMPNLNLTDVEIKALVAYLEASK